MSAGTHDPKRDDGRRVGKSLRRRPTSGCSARRKSVLVADRMASALSSPRPKKLPEVPTRSSKGHLAVTFALPMATPRRELSPADTKEQEQSRASIVGADAFDERIVDCEGDDEVKSAISRRRLDG